MNIDTVLSKFTLQRFVIFVFIIILIGYTVFEAYDLWIGPNLTIVSPLNGALVEEDLVTIEGATKNVTWISMLGRPIPIDEQGRFREKLLLPPGYSILTFEAKDRLGRKTTKTLSLVRPWSQSTSSIEKIFTNATPATSTSTATSTPTELINTL